MWYSRTYDIDILIVRERNVWIGNVSRESLDARVACEYERTVRWFDFLINAISASEDKCHKMSQEIVHEYCCIEMQMRSKQH